MGIAVWAWNTPVKSCCSEWSSPSWCGCSGGLGTFRRQVWLVEVGHQKQTLTVKLVPDSSLLPWFSPPCGHPLPSTWSSMNWVSLTCHRTATGRNFWNQNKPFPTLCYEMFCYRGEEAAIEWASFLVCKNDNVYRFRQEKCVQQRSSLPAPRTLEGQWIFTENLQCSVCVSGWGRSGGHC